MLDLSKNNFAEIAEAGHRFELKLPGSNIPTGAFVTVRGEQSKLVKAFARKKFSEYRMREQAARRRGKEVDEMSIDEAEDLAVESAIVRIISWEGITEGKNEVPFTKENAERVLKAHNWIRDQIQEESSQLLNFQPE